jgi:hypothetical protein
MKFVYHTDPGHGWVEAPVALLAELGIASKITPYSYVSHDGKIAYLEEDCDAGVLMQAVKARGDTVEIQEAFADPCFVRGLPGYTRPMEHIAYLSGLPLVEALWWFIENIPDDHPRRNDVFFYLRERYRNELMTTEPTTAN